MSKQGVTLGKQFEVQIYAGIEFSWLTPANSSTRPSRASADPAGPLHGLSHDGLPPILHRKEAFVSADYSLREKFVRLSRQEECWGLYEHPTAIGTRQAWERLLAEKGVRLTGHRVTRVTSSRREGCAVPRKQ